MGFNEPTFTEEQTRAIETTDRAVALIAAAGSGKTTVLIHRYLRLLRLGAPPQKILCVTFTNEAADQLRERIVGELRRQDGNEKLAELVEASPNIGTIHSFCYRTLDQYGSQLGFEPIRKILGTYALANEFEEAYQRWLEELPREALAQLLSHFSHADLRNTARHLFSHRSLFRRALDLRNDSPGQEEAACLDLLARSMPALHSKLEKAFISQGAYTFDDLEQYTLRLLQEVPAVGEQLRSQLDYLLVDEFQDTSLSQWEILKHCLGDTVRKLFVVGDPKQSIYRFRNADVRLFLAVSQWIVDSGGDQLELTTNFRSHPNLLEAINHCSQALFLGSAFPFSPMQSDRRLLATQASRFEICRYPLEPGEVQAVTEQIAQLLASGVRPQQIAVLFRVSDRIATFSQALETRSIPTACKRTVSLFQIYDVLDLVNFLKAVQNPLDDVATTSFLASSFVGLCYGELSALQNLPGDSLYEKLSTGKQVAWFCELIESGDFDLVSVLRRLFTHSPYWPTSCDAMLEFLRPLLEESLNVSEAVRRIEIWKRDDVFFQSESATSAQDAVQLMTVHGAKGLEFDHVFIVDNLRQMPRRSPPVWLSANNTPGVRFRRDGELVPSETYTKLKEEQYLEDCEESKRILYVALTRAKENLYIYLPQNLKKFPKESWAEFLESFQAS